MILPHEFLALRGADEVAGMVLVDASHERDETLYPRRDADVEVVTKGVDYLDVPGLNAKHALTGGEVGGVSGGGGSENHKRQAEWEEERVR